MLQDALFLTKTPFFSGFTDKQFQDTLLLLKAYTESYQKGETIYSEGSLITCVGAVLSGKLEISNNSITGTTSVLEVIGPGELFGEAYACTPGQPLLIDVLAQTDCEVLFFSVPALFSAPDTPERTLLLRRLLTLCAEKNIRLSRRIVHTASKTIRGRLLSYFSQQAALQNSRSFDIALDRQQLADYLSVDRSALSKELGRMQQEGLLRFKKNHFEILMENTL